MRNRRNNTLPVKRNNTLPVKTNNTLPVKQSYFSGIGDIIKQSIIHSVIFNGTSRIFDNIFGSREIQIKNNNVNNNINCDEIIDMYNNISLDKKNKYEQQYNECINK